MRAEIRGGRWKNRTCKRCPYYAFARGEIATRGELRRRRDLKRSPCRRCPARGFMGR